MNTIINDSTPIAMLTLGQLKEALQPQQQNNAQQLDNLKGEAKRYATCMGLEEYANYSECATQPHRGIKIHF